MRPSQTKFDGPDFAFQANYFLKKNIEKKHGPVKKNLRENVAFAEKYGIGFHKINYGE